MPDQITNEVDVLAGNSFSPVPLQLSLAQQFEHLSASWKKETGHISNVTRKCTNPAYQRIIGLGFEAVPFILRDLKSSHDDWFWALSSITGDNPITETDAGNTDLMTEAWLRWGKAKGYDV